MPRYTSSFHPGVDYRATADYHAKIETLLAQLDAREPGSAKDTIFRLVKIERIEKGRAIFEALCRRHPGLAPAPPADPDATYVHTAELMKALAESTPKNRYDRFGRPQSRGCRPPEVIYADIINAENALPSQSKGQADITALTVELLEDALDVAIEDRDSGTRDTTSPRGAE